MNPLILVVDDEPDVAALFRQQFRREMRAGRFAMDFATSAPAALAWLEDQAANTPVLVLSDINMPGMTGLELLPRVKALRPELPVIMITAYGDAETRRLAREGGAQDVYAKPIDFGALRAEIDQRLGGQGLPA